MKLCILTAFLLLTSQSLKASDEDKFNILVIDSKLKNNEITPLQAAEWSEEATKVRDELFNGKLSTESSDNFWNLVDKISPQSTFPQ